MWKVLKMLETLSENGQFLLFTQDFQKTLNADMEKPGYGQNPARTNPPRIKPHEQNPLGQNPHTLN